jgi:hypothetical protein
VQTRRNARVVEDGVLFAARHKREPDQIGKHGTCSILAVEPEQRAFQ